MPKRGQDAEAAWEMLPPAKSGVTVVSSHACSRAGTLCHNSKRFSPKRKSKFLGRSGVFFYYKISFARVRECENLRQNFALEKAPNAL
jgi:hypothetical protein